MSFFRATSLDTLLASAKRAVDAIAAVPGSDHSISWWCLYGPAVKSDHDMRPLKASTNEAFCPSLVGRVSTQLAPEVAACLEIVIDGENEGVVSKAMAAAIQAAVGEGILGSICR